MLGTVDIDNIGIAGIEKWIESQGLDVLRQTGMDLSHQNLQPVTLTLDIRIQHALQIELAKAIEKFGAKAGAGLVLDITNGEVLALASAPDFDPNTPADALKPDRINRIAAATFEMGSTFKALTTAMALDSGQFNIRSVIDASRPLAFGRFRIRDYRGKYRPLSLPEAFIYSSNIAMAKMAIALGPENFRAFLSFRTDVATDDRVAGERASATAALLARDRYGNRILRPRHCRDAAAGEHCGCGPRQRRAPDQADIDQRL